MRLSFLVLFLLAEVSAFSQIGYIDVRSEILETAESFMNEDESDQDALHEQAEILDRFYHRKIYVDVRCEPELTALGFLSPHEVRSILLYIEKYGPLSAREELYRIPDLDERKIRWLMFFIRYEQNFELYRNKIDKRSQHAIRIRTAHVLQKSRAFTEGNVYRGNPFYKYIRYQCRVNQHLDVGVQAEKDIGEKTFLNGRRPFDYQSAYVEFNNKGPLHRIILGDFNVSFGQGLTLNTTGRRGKSSEVLLTGNYRQNLRPHTSLDEFHFLRGLATEILFKSFKITTVFSRRMLDANQDVEHANRFTSFHTSGLHRSESEEFKRSKVRSIVAGMDVQFDKNDVLLGLVTSHKMLSNPIKDPSFEEDDWMQDQLNAGVYTKINKSNFSLFSEFSSNGLDYAYTGGFVIMPTARLSLTSFMRKFGANFTSQSNGTFAENNAVIDEKGIYHGMQYKFHPNILLSAYTDAFTSSIPSNRALFSTKGIDYFVSIRIRPRRGEEVYLHLKWKEKSKDGEGLHLPGEAVEKRKNLRFQYMKTVEHGFRLRSRIEFAAYEFESICDPGFLAFQEIKYKKFGSPISILVRFTAFETKSYNSRIYTFEQDVSGIFYIPAFYGKGSKLLIFLRCKMGKKQTLEMKIGHTVYEDRQIIGSGWDEIKGPEKSQFRLQYQLKF